MIAAAEGLKPIFELVRVTEILEIASHIARVDGWLTIKEGAILNICAKYGPAQGEIVEIGSFKGRSTVWLSLGSKAANREKITAIDPHIGSPEHQEGGFHHSRMPESGSTRLDLEQNLNFFRVHDWVNIMEMASSEAAKQWTKPIRLLFIDGAHQVDMVEQDLLMWEPHTVAGGVIAFHDIYGEDGGPDQVVNKYIRNNPKYTEIFHVDGLLVVQKNY